ncbi:MAG: rod shape-determining protein MreD [Anaerolineae bacterium]|nr:rod shape-determining protein MreD [Anaerolineae bacterium]NIN98315.1 rod shape-determining protein MreD [Anaerolineae bacterium]NIQ81244.1 rod shape-determining protein MreD [Anaerolineae bacterium]
MPIKTYAAFALLAAVALVQSSVLYRFSLVGARLNLMLLVVVSWSLLRGPREGIVWGFIGGLSLDFLSGAPIGSCAFALTVAGYLASLGQLTLYRTSPAFPSVVALGTSLVYDIIIMILLSTTGRLAAWQETLVAVTMPTALLASLMMPLVHRGLTWLHRKTLPEETELQ